MEPPVNMKPPITTIIFDCFGVLLGNTYKHHLSQLEGQDPSKAEQLRAINHAADMGILDRQETATYMADILGVSPQQLLDEQDAGEVRNEQLLAYIATLKPRFKVGLLSNLNGRSRLQIRFEPGQLESLFDVVVVSGDEGYVKPQPEIYEITASRLGSKPEECLMIDDIREYCDGAEVVGMRAIQFLTTEQCLTDVRAIIDRHV